MMILKIIFWTVIVTAWIAGTVISQLKCKYHLDLADRGRIHEELIMAALFGIIAVALPVSAVITFFMLLLTS